MCILFIKVELQLTEFIALICVKLNISCLQMDQSDWAGFKPFLRLLSKLEWSQQRKYLQAIPLPTFN